MRRPSEPVDAALGARAILPDEPPSGRGPAPPADRLRALAGRVRRLGLAGRFDPESAYAEREEVARALHRLSRELERAAAGPQPLSRPWRSAATPAPERLLALLASRTRELDRLRALLAEVVRPPRRRRARPSPDQLALDLSEARDADA
jgi:hypothetical protein